MNYPVSPEYCLILKALYETETLREAARLLDMDPAHLTRKLQKMPAEYNLVEKAGNRWILTDAGKRIALWVEEGIGRQKELLEQKPVQRIACFTWLAEQLLIPNYPKLNSLTHNRYSWSFDITSSSLEHAIITGQAEYVITCHSPNDPLIAHKKFEKDPWIIVVPTSWKKDLSKIKSQELVEYLQTKPFVRLSTTDPEHILGFFPKKNAELSIDGVMGVRAAVVNGLGWSCLPSYSLISCLKNQEVIKLEIDSMTQGDLSIWWLRSRKDFSENVKIISKWVSEISK